jgi:hypothetical protein
VSKPRKTAKQLSREINEALDKFDGVKIGTLVRRSKHWHKVHPSDVKGQLGIVVDRNVYQEGGRLVTYPVIHWEEQHGSSSTHPDNAEIAPSAFKRALGLRGKR